MLLQSQIRSFQLGRLGVRACASILEYLSDEELPVLGEALALSECGLFLQMTSLRSVIRNYFAKADRSFYFSVYSRPQLDRIEMEHLYYFGSQQKIEQIGRFPARFYSLLGHLQRLLPQPLGHQFTAKLSLMFVDPDIPLPRLHRESVASFIGSPYQSYLCTLSGLTMGYQQDATDDIASHFQEHEEHYLRQMIKTQCRTTELLRQFGHEVTHDTLSRFQAPDNDLHNLIVAILGLTQLYLSGIRQTLQAVEDPFGLLLQFANKYTQFQSTVISFEENFGFIFRTFDELQSEINGRTSQGPFSFFKSAMRMWRAAMSDFHPNTHQSFLNLLDIQITAPYEEMARNCCDPDLSATLLWARNRALGTDQNMSPALEVMQVSSPGDIELLISTYCEYLVDMSIHEHNCSYFYHSMFKFDQTYVQMEECLARREEGLVERLKRHQREDVRGVFEQRVKGYHYHLKPATPARLLRMYEEKGVGRLSLAELQETDQVIESYNRLGLGLDIVKPLDDNSTTLSETSQSTVSSVESEES